MLRTDGLISDVKTMSWFEEQRKTNISKLNGVQILLVQANGQVFALLMSQLFNILRPEAGRLKIRGEFTREDKLWTEVEYRLQVLPVLPITSALLIETEPVPLEQCEILMSGCVTQNTNVLEQVFGLAVERVLTVHFFRMEEMRRLPSWLYQKRLGNLIIGAVLVKRELLDNKQAEQISSENDSAAWQSGDAALFDLETDKNLRFRSTRTERKADVYNRYLNNSVSNKEQDQHRPVILLNLDALRSQLYRG